MTSKGGKVHCLGNVTVGEASLSTLCDIITSAVVDACIFSAVLSPVLKSRGSKRDQGY